MNTKFSLSAEQRLFISKAKDRKNILVDACIGSGKTTAIQYLCDELPATLKILYLTYNKLLKLDAKAKIRNSNTTVTNYHGFAFMSLKKIGVKAGISDLIQRFNKEKPMLEHYDVLIDVPVFMKQFLGGHINLQFTSCFRLSTDLASMLGRVWQKKIIGVNNNCIVEKMTVKAVVNFLTEQNPEDILCLGARWGDLSDILNLLEEKCPEKFNKKTVYASISDRDATGATQPKPTSAIFTTFDSSKGLERKICVVFDFTESYWQSRISKPQQSYKILRNIFCVAASRGKERIIFVNSEEAMLSEKTLSTDVQTSYKFQDVDISEMFDFKYKEDIEECYSLLQVRSLTKPENLSEIHISNKDDLIDLSPCIGIYQEAVFFSGYEIDKSIEFFIDINIDKKFIYSANDRNLTLDKKILFLVSMETKQNDIPNAI